MHAGVRLVELGQSWTGQLLNLLTPKSSALPMGFLAWEHTHTYTKSVREHQKGGSDPTHVSANGGLANIPPQLRTLTVVSVASLWDTQPKAYWPLSATGL